jgi:uncharacterized protein
MQKGVINFEDLHEGMKVTGKIKNVVDFGAFVDLGIKETALIHISELSDHFVKDPMSVVKVGDVLEFHIIGLDQDRRRISLSRKSGEHRTESSQTSNRRSENTEPELREQRKPQTQGEKAAVAVYSRDGKAKPPPQKPRGDSYRQADGDGTTYNPFADAFRKMREKK